MSVYAQDGPRKGKPSIDLFEIDGDQINIAGNEMFYLRIDGNMVADQHKMPELLKDDTLFN